MLYIILYARKTVEKLLQQISKQTVLLPDRWVVVDRQKDLNFSILIPVLSRGRTLCQTRASLLTYPQQSEICQMHFQRNLCSRHLAVKTFIKYNKMLTEAKVLLFSKTEKCSDFFCGIFPPEKIFLNRNISITNFSEELLF